MPEHAMTDDEQAKRRSVRGDIVFGGVQIMAFALGLLAGTCCLAVATLLPAGGRSRTLLIVEASLGGLALLLLGFGWLLRKVAFEAMMREIRPRD